MPVDRSQFKIEIGTSADVSALEKTISMLEKARDAAAAQGKDTSLYDAAIDKNKTSLHALKKALEDTDHAAEHMAVSHREAHQALNLLNEATNGALGPLGELAHMLGNPYIMAAAGAALAIKMLTEQHEKARESMMETIKLVQDMHDAFDANLKNAIIKVTEAVADFHRTLSHAGEVQNQFAARLAADAPLIATYAESVRSVAKAEQELADARIQAAQLAGQITSPEAHAQEEQARRQERQAEEQTAHDQAAAEIADKRAAANKAQAESDRKQADHDSEDRTKRRAELEAAKNDAGEVVKDREKTRDAKKEELEKAQADAESVGPRPSNQDVDRVPKMLAAARAAHVAGATGMVAGEAEALEIQKRIELYKKLDEARAAFDAAQSMRDTANKHLSEITIMASNYEDEAKRLADRAVQMKTFADETRRAADAQEALNNARERGLERTDPIQDQTQSQRRRNYLQQRRNNGQLTPDEQAEYEGAFEHGAASNLGQVESRIRAIQSNIRLEGGHASDAENEELHRLLSLVVGLMENQFGVSNRTANRLDNYYRRLQVLEQTHATSASPAY